MLKNNDIFDFNSFESIVKSKLSLKRYNHSLFVQETAVKLAKIYNADIINASAAGLLHDITKDEGYDSQLKMSEEFGIMLSNEERCMPQILHAATGAGYIEHILKINNKDILNAVRYHTTGRKNMSLLEKIVYIADYIEPSRTFEGLDSVRNLAYTDLDSALYLAIKMSVKYIVSKDKLLHTDTIDCYNNLNLKIRVE